MISVDFTGITTHMEVVLVATSCIAGLSHGPVDVANVTKSSSSKSTTSCKLCTYTKCKSNGLYCGLGES